MKIEHRSYNTQTFRPRPQLHIEPDGGLIVVATSWGVPEHATLVVEEIAKYVVAARSDVEVTSPFDKKSYLSDQANHLRIGCLLANEILYRRENRVEYQSGVEVVVLTLAGQHLAWAQVGAPHILLKRAARNPLPIATSFDLSFELSDGKNLPPLPTRFLGTEPQCEIQAGDLKLETNDQIILFACSELPSALWNFADFHQLHQLTSTIVQTQPDTPFWLGLIDQG